VEIAEITEIAEIVDIVGTVSGNLRIRRRRGIFVVLLMQRSGVRSIIPTDLKECKTFLDRKKMPPPASVAQEPHRGKHRRADHDNEDQMEEINIIFRGSMSITSKTQG
jgi:hypothetical protein